MFISWHSRPLKHFKPQVNELISEWSESEPWYKLKGVYRIPTERFHWSDLHVKNKSTHFCCVMSLFVVLIALMHCKTWCIRVIDDVNWISSVLSLSHHDATLNVFILERFSRQSREATSTLDRNKLSYQLDDDEEASFQNMSQRWTDN